MGSPLDILLIKQLVLETETVNTDYKTEAVDLSFRENEFSIQFDYSNGSSVNMVFYIEYSVDGNTFVRDEDSDVAVSDPTHTHIWDIAETGAAYLKIGIEVNAGSIDLDQILIKQKRRH